MTGIFINYRREDGHGPAGRLYDRLSRNFARHQIFMDVDAMKPGIDFAKQIDEQVSKCAVVLAVIGPSWLNSTDDKGQRRLERPRDHVRMELATALKREIPVIPLLVNGTPMPSEDDLPEDLKSLAHRHGLELRHSRFAADSEAVVQHLNDILRRGRRWPLWVGAAVAGLSLLALLTWAVDFGVVQGRLARALAAWTAQPPTDDHRAQVALPQKPPASPIPSPIASPSVAMNVATPPASAGGARVALVIGNAKYPDNDATLKTPVADAHSISDALRQFEFSILGGVNLSADQTKKELEKLYGQLTPGSTVLIFFSGFAVQSNHKNYLLPVDAQIWSEEDARRDGLDLESVLGEIRRLGATLQIALIDASRRTPYDRRFRSLSAGLAPVNVPTGAMVMYSSGLNIAQNDPDAGAGNSLFVTQLLNVVRSPTVNPTTVLNEVRVAIVKASHEEQIPWLEDQSYYGFNIAPGSSPRH
jgi:hypothetical protein